MALGASGRAPWITFTGSTAADTLSRSGYTPPEARQATLPGSPARKDDMPRVT